MIGVVEPLQQLHAGALPAAAAAHEGQRLAGLHRHVQSVQDLDVGPGGVGELAVNEVEVPLEVILKTQGKEASRSVRVGLCSMLCADLIRAGLLPSAGSPQPIDSHV